MIANTQQGTGRPRKKREKNGIIWAVNEMDELKPCCGLTPIRAYKIGGFKSPALHYLIRCGKCKHTVIEEITDYSENGKNITKVRAIQRWNKEVSDGTAK